MQYSDYESPNVYGPTVRVDSRQPMTNYMINYAHPGAMPCGSQIGANHRVFPFSYPRYHDGGQADNYTGQQTTAAPAISQSNGHYDINAVQSEPYDNTDTTTPHPRTTAPCEFPAILHHLQHLGSCITSLAKDINEIKLASAKQEQIDRLSVQTHQQHEKLSMQIQGFDQQLSLIFQFLQESMATKQLHTELQVISDRLLAELQTLQDCGKYDSDASPSQSADKQQKQSKDRQPLGRPLTEPKPQDPQQNMICIKGFFASLHSKRLFKLLTNYGTVLSLRRCGRGWAVATMESAKEAKEALQLHGHWGTAQRPGITVEWYKPNRNQAKLPPEGEEFIGSASHQRMQVGAGPKKPPEETVKDETKRQEDINSIEVQPNGNTPCAGSKSSPPGQRSSTRPKLGKRKQRENTISPPVPSTAKASLKIELFESKLTSGESPPQHSQHKGINDKCKGFGGATNAGQQAQRIPSKARGDTTQSASTERTGQEQQAAQGGESRATVQNPQSGITPTLTEQQVRAIYSFDSASQLWIPKAKVLDQWAQGQNPPRQVRDVMGDGNCQSRAIVATGQTNYANFRLLKAAAKEHLRTNSAPVRRHLVAQNLIQPNDKRWRAQLNEHLDASSGHLAYGTEVSLGLYSILLQTEIRVYDAQSGEISQVSCPIPARQAPQNKPLELGYRRHQHHHIYDSNFQPTPTRAEGHYWAIIPFQGNGMGSG